MNHITDLLDLEDADIIISGIQIQDQTKTLTLETPPTAHFCPSCGFRMHSRGVKNRDHQSSDSSGQLFADPCPETAEVALYQPRMPV